MMHNDRQTHLDSAGKPVSVSEYCPMCGRSDECGEDCSNHDEARRVLVALRAVLDGSAMDAAIILWLCVSPVRSYQQIADRLGVTKMAVAHRVKSIAGTWPELGRMVLDCDASDKPINLTGQRIEAAERLIQYRRAESGNDTAV